MPITLEETSHPAARELARRFRRSQPARLFGFELIAAAPGRARMQFQVGARHRQMHGVVHGGILGSLADTAAALSCYLALPRGTRLATVEMKINYLEPVAGGRVLAEGRMLRLGKYLAVAECEIHDAAGRLAAKALLTFSIGPARSGPKQRKKAGSR
jgi:uncharacterized protein (TIGR00369 family)